MLQFLFVLVIQLWLHEGDIVMVMDMHQSGWWLGQVSSKTGDGLLPTRSRSSLFFSSL